LPQLAAAHSHEDDARPNARLMTTSTSDSAEQRVVVKTFLVPLKAWLVVMLVVHVVALLGFVFGTFWLFVALPSAFVLFGTLVGVRRLGTRSSFVAKFATACVAFSRAWWIVAESRLSLWRSRSRRRRQTHVCNSPAP
jgi:hypothetical protein